MIDILYRHKVHKCFHFGDGLSSLRSKIAIFNANSENKVQNDI